MPKAASLPLSSNKNSSSRKVISRNRRFESHIESILDAPSTEDNSIQILVNGKEIFPAMLDAIKRSQKSIHFETSVFGTGNLASEFAVSIAERASAGVECDVLIDSAGCSKIGNELITKMRDAGATVAFFKAKSLGQTVSKHQTRRNILIADRELAFTGGASVSDEWGGDASGPDEWHDIHFRISGPVVSQIFNAFADNWNGCRENTGRIFPKYRATSENYPIVPPPRNVKHSGGFRGLRAQGYYSSGSHGQNRSFELCKFAVDHARKSICLEAAYFVPDNEMVGHLIGAVRRGVDVKIIMPDKKCDSWLSRVRSRASWGRLLDAGVEVYRYMPTTLRARFMVVDDEWVVIGPSNFDTQVFRQCDEVNFNVFNHRFAGRLRRIFDFDLGRSRRIEMIEWKQRGIRRRAEEIAAKLMVPLTVR